jgi:hypothetical protein
MLSHDECIRAAMKQFIEDDREFRRIETDPHAQFLDWKEGKGAGRSIVIENTRRACKNQDVKLKLGGAFTVIKTDRSEKKTNYAFSVG